MPLIVQKYGGSSLATPAHIQRAARRIKELRETGTDVVVVASAMGRMTDHLIRLANKTVARPPQRELDMLLTAGERVSISLLAMALEDMGVRAISFTGSQTGIVTTSDHTEARILEIRAQRAHDALAAGKVVIIAGFQGVSRDKEITTLGRGGSDTSAVAIAAALGADWCEILTDVDGLFTADPRLVPTAQLIRECSYEEALELASLGAKMHSRSLEVAKKYQVRVRIASSQHRNSPGTEVTPETSNRLPEEGGQMETPRIRGIATRDGFSLFRASAGLGDIVGITGRNRVLLRFFNESEGEVRFVCDRDKAPIVRDALSALSIPFDETAKVSIVSAVGEGLSASANLLPELWEALRGEEGRPVGVLLMSANSVSISVVVTADQRETAARRLHACFLETDGPQKERETPLAENLPLQTS